MKVSFNDIFHLEKFSVGNEEFIKDTHHLAKGNAVRRSGKRDYVFFPLETLVHRLVHRKEPSISIQFAD